MDGTCEWTNGNTRMPATYVAWTLCPSLHTCARMHPIPVTLWDQFSEIEAAAMANLPGTFPVAIGMRLKMSNYHVNVTDTHKCRSLYFVIYTLNEQYAKCTCIGLATRNLSICGDHLHDLIESYGLEENVHHREQNMAHPD